MTRKQITAVGVGVALVIGLILFTYMGIRPKPMPKAFENLWSDLATSESACYDFDFWPEGGMRNFYCHLASLTSLAELQKAFGRPIFLSGPHTHDSLDLENENEFGHYNPEFVKWLIANVIPRDPALKRRLSPVFETYVQRLAELYLKAVLKLESDPAELKEEMQYYFDYMATREKLSVTRPLDRYYDYLPDETYPSPAVAFWLRRKIDGTADLFKDGLVQLMEEFVPDRLEALRRIDWAAQSGTAWEKEEYQDDEPSSEIDKRELSLEFDNGTAAGLMRNLWTSIADTQSRCLDQFDYFPQGGLRVYFCHALDIISLQNFKHLVGHKIFLSGPHDSTGLDLNNRHEFGRYNPAFVQWIIDNAIPGADDESFKERTAVIFDNFIGPVTRTFYLTGKLLEEFPGEYKNNLLIYKAWMQGEGESFPVFDPFEKYVEILRQETFKGQIDSVFSPSAASFWMRRDLDGTQDLFKEAITNLLKTYDLAFVEQVESFDFSKLRSKSR